MLSSSLDNALYESETVTRPSSFYNEDSYIHNFVNGALAEAAEISNEN